MFSFAIVGCVVALCSISMSSAATRIWIGGSSNNWYSSANWSPVGGPDETDQLSVFVGTIIGSQSPVVRDGGSILLSGASTNVSFPPLWFLNVGETGTGTVTVRNGADLTSFNATFVGDEVGSDGKLYVQGAGSTFTTNNLRVGLNGLGLMEITDGAKVFSDSGNVALNSTAAGSKALVSGQGSLWDMGTNAFSTLAGHGFLEVSQGGTVMNGQGRLGVNGGRGEATVAGSRSEWLNSDSLDVGYYGAGQLTVADGGRVTAKDLGVHSLTFIGQGTSSIIVEGDGSRLEIDNSTSIGQGFGIGNDGPGSLTVRDGGILRTGGTTTIFSPGTVTLEAGGSLYTDVLQRSSGGQFNMLSTSQLYTNELIGFSGNTNIGGSLNLGHSGGNGSFQVGSGDVLFVNRGLVVGLDNGSSFDLTATNGGVIDSGIASVGAFSGSTGVVNVNSGSTWQNVDVIQLGLLGHGTLNVAGGEVRTSRLVLGQSGGVGTVNVSAGASVIVNGMLSVGNTSTFQLASGHLKAGTVNLNESGTFDFSEATLEVEQFDGDLIQDAGTLVTYDSPGSTTVSRDYTFNTGTLAIQLGGLEAGSQFDFFEVTGDVQLAGGSLNVMPIDGFQLDVDQQFDILRIGGSLNGTFAGLDEGALVGQFGGTDLFITYQAGDGNDIALVTTEPTLAGDFDMDQDVDGHDFLEWQRGLATAAELGEWKSNFGEVASPVAANTAAVPEPSSMGLLALALFAFTAIRNEL